MDRPNPDHANAGERKELKIAETGLVYSFTDRGAIVDMICCIHSDIFYQDRYMLNEVNVKVRLVKNKDSFCLMSGEANGIYKVKLINAVLLVRKMQLSQSVFLAYAKVLESGLAKYQIKQVVCKSNTTPAGNLDGNHEKLFSRQLPSRLVIGCVNNYAFNGNYVKNPFNFKHYALSEICIHLDGADKLNSATNTQPVKLPNQIMATSSTSRHT